MPGPTQDKTIKGHTYRVEPLGGSSADDVFPIIFKEALRTGEPTREERAFVRAHFAASTRIKVVDPAHPDADRWVPLKDSFDEHFAGRMAAQAPWRAFCVEVNFGDFFDDLRAAIAKAKTDAESKSSSPPEPAGTSTGSSSAHG